MKKYIICKICVFCLFLYSANVYASPSYYNDNRYEKSSIYANVNTDESVKNIVQNATKGIETKSSSKTIQDGKTKKVYNTIIVRTKKNKAEKVINNESITTNNNIQPLPLKKVEQKKNTEEKTLMQKIQDYTNVFRQTRPDSFYFYGLVGYAMSMPKSIITSAIYENNEMHDARFNSIRVDGHNKGSGFGLIVGLKAYFNRHLFALFFSPELFYNRLSVFTNGLTYNTYGSSWYFNTSGVVDANGDYPKESANIRIPATIRITPKDMMGLTLRFGFTVANFLSIFAKASLGGSYYHISNSANIAGVNWDNYFSWTTAEQLAHKEDNIEELKAHANSNGILYANDGDYSKKKLTMVYGFGIGIELAFWNQHFMIRGDYDHYFSSIRFKTEPQFARIADAVEITDNTASVESNTAWKTRSSFGVFKITLGLAF